MKKYALVQDFKPAYMFLNLYYLLNKSMYLLYEHLYIPFPHLLCPYHVCVYYIYDIYHICIL